MTLFKVDENLSPHVALLLRSRGHVVDKGFTNIRVFPPERFAGLVVLRLTCQARDYVLAAFAAQLPALEKTPLAGALVIVEERAIRVYRWRPRPTRP